MGNGIPKSGEQPRPLTHSEDFYVRKLLNEVKVSEVMTGKVISVEIDAPFSSVAAILNSYRIRHVPVVGPGKRLVGLVTQRDLYRLQSPRRLENGDWYYDQEYLDQFILKNVMITNPFVLHPQDTLAKALVPMVKSKFGCIPIVDQDHILKGILTQHDILNMAVRILEE